MGAVFEGAGQGARSRSLQASVVVPVRGRPKELGECLQSLAAQASGDTAFEVLICDDGSQPELTESEYASYTRGLNCRWLRQSPLGPAAARNLGMHRANAEIVVFVDSDVVLDGHCLTRLVGALREHEKWAGAEACLQPVGEGDGPLWDAPTSQSGGHYHTAAIAYRRAALIDVGGLDESFRLPACEDVELAMRVLEIGPIGFVADAVALHPRRRVNLRTHWNWRKHWFYTMVLAVRYGILGFPGQPAGRFPRLRVALAACCTLPLGRLRAALRHGRGNPAEGTLALAFALFDIVVGCLALPDILLARVPERPSASAVQNTA